MRISLFTFSIFLSLAVFLTCTSCKDDIDLTPSYLKIDNIDLSVSAEQGSSSHIITDAWIYINDNIQGVYELPAKFPVLSTGNNKLMVRPGIKSNGIGATRIFYPFFNPIILDFDFQRDSISELELTATYHSQVIFQWLEDFEDGGISIEPTVKSDVGINKTDAPDHVFEGNYSARVVLDSNNYFFESRSVDAFQMPQNGSPVFLELNYKNNAKVHVGIFANRPGEVVQRSVLVLNETDNWRKIYINLTNAISENFNATDYRVFFGMIRDEEDPTVRKAYFDNIKLLHF